jgi:hypothetical protein
LRYHFLYYDGSAFNGGGWDGFLPCLLATTDLNIMIWAHKAVSDGLVSAPLASENMFISSQIVRCKGAVGDV